MKRFNNTWNVGDVVKVIGLKGYHKLVEIHPTRGWIKLYGFDCFFKEESVEKLSQSKIKEYKLI